MRREIQPANRAVVVDLEEGAKQLAFAAAGAAATESALQRGPYIALLGRRGILGPNHLVGAHGFHDLPLFDLPDFASPDLRSFLRGLRPGCGLACGPATFWRLPRRGAAWPSDNSSNRKAPATGAASTRRTSTTSPSRCMAPLRDPTSACRVSS